MITPLDSTIKGVMEFTWPMIVICLLIVSSLRITDMIKNKKEFILHKELLILFFMIYILCLFQVVTFEDTSLMISGNNFIPFKEIMRYELGSKLFFKNVLGNLAMFIPYGFFASLYLKLDKKYQSFLIITFASVSIETTQLLIGRVFDVDDIILNIIGGMIGYFIYRLLEKIGDSLPKIFKSNWFLNIITTIAVILLVGYLYMVVK